MKKIFLFIAIAMFSANVANAQLDNLLNQVKSAATKATSSNSTLSTLTNVISSKLVPTSSQIVGTWSYEKPAVMFTSSNSLKSSAAAVATSSLETKLQTYLTKAGVKKGTMSITFNSDKTFTINNNGKSLVKGTYSISGSEISMAFNNKQVPAKFTPQLYDGSLCLVGDASKLKTLLENSGTKLNASTLSAITSLSKSMTGLKLGVRMSKK